VNAETIEQRIPPSDLDAEGAVISAVLADKAALEKVLPLLTPAKFYSEAHRRIFEAILALHGEGKPADVVTVATWLRDRERLAQVGGMAYLTEVLNTAPAVANVTAYAATVDAKWRARKIILMAQRVTSQGYGGADPDALVASATAEIEAIGQPAKATLPAVPLIDRARALRQRGPIRRLATGLASLDKACRGGFAVPRLVVIGGAPGAGKTALVVWIGVTLAQAGVPVVMLAVDEGADDILLRVALLLGVDVERLEAGDEIEWDTFESNLSPLPLTLLDGDEGWTIETAAAHLATFTADQPGVLVVDSAQTVDAKGTVEAESPRTRADAVVRSLKHVVRSNPFLVLATSELARGAYRSRNTADQINDLAAFKESGSIEYAAQTAVVLRSVPDGGGAVDVAIPKNRGGKKDGFCIEIDQRTRVREVDAPSEPDKAESRAAKITDDAATVLAVIVQKPGLPGKAAIRTAVRASGASLGNERVDAALERLLDQHRVENRGTETRPRFHARSEAA
jgi:replicative DNA helicase